MTLLEELRANKFTLTERSNFYGEAFTYKTDTHTIEILYPLFGAVVYVDNKKVSWWQGIKIRRAIHHNS